MSYYDPEYIRGVRRANGTYTRWRLQAAGMERAAADEDRRGDHLTARLLRASAQSLRRDAETESAE